MKYLRFIFFILLIGCQPKKSDSLLENTSASREDSSEGKTYTEPAEVVLPDQSDWDYQLLYGSYQHESNSTGFSASLTINPEGNDVSFILSVNQNACSGRADGIIGMAHFSDDEYTGFYNHADCRLQFTFSPKQQTVRIEEIGLCMLHEKTCRFDGVYFRNTQ